jgi:hypothetical protein
MIFLFVSSRGGFGEEEDWCVTSLSLLVYGALSSLPLADTAVARGLVEGGAPMRALALRERESQVKASYTSSLRPHTLVA